MITINMAKARNIHRNRIRAVREPLLAALDVQFQRALERNQSTADIVARKQALRDAPDDPAIEAAQTLEQLKAFWPAILGPR